MKSFKRLSLFATSLAIIVCTLLMPPAVHAVNVFNNGTTNAGTDVVNNKGNDTLQTTIGKIISLILFGVGLLSVIMIIIAGIRYTTSNGDAGQVKSAKDTLLYAVVGLIVAILAYAIVNFVLGAFK